MPEPETFDAFYARTVWNVTSQMHELAGGDGLADHAVREAYARAYQQWYQVSGSRDPEGWVLGAARDAYERRQAEGGAGRGLTAMPADSGTWPGIYRPVAPRGPRAAGQDDSPPDPHATVARPWRDGAGRHASPGPDARGAVPAAPYLPAQGRLAAAGIAAGGLAAGAGSDLADSPPDWFSPASRTIGTAGRPGPGGAGPGGSGSDGPGSDWQGPDGREPDGPGGEYGRGGPGRGGPGTRGPGRQWSRRNLVIAGVAAAAVVIALVAYSAGGGGHKAPSPAASPTTTAKAAAKPKPHMLGAGRTGQRSAVPWSLVGSGWALAEFSTDPPNSAGQALGSGSYTTYLVDPEGGKYAIETSSGGTEPELTAWSGDDRTALFDTAAGFELLNVRTGQLAPLQLPAGVAAIGFARPLGLAILAVRMGPAEFHLQRYSLAGRLEASLAELPRQQGQSLPQTGCESSSVCALSSPDGLHDVWGVTGDEMQVLSNAGGKPTRLHVKDSGHPASCMPLSWWNDTTILATCVATDLPDGDQEQLWLLPDTGSQPTPLTSATSAAGGDGIRDAWLGGQTTYVGWQTSHQCPSAPSGPGGMDIVPLGQTLAAAIDVPGTTSNFSSIVATKGRRLLVLTQTQCPGTSSLLWLNPATHTAQTVLTAPASEVGVIAAVPFGNGPTAVTNGQY